MDLETTKNDLTEETRAQLMDEYGLTENKLSLIETLFQGDFGFTINFSMLIPSIILLLILGFLLFLFNKGRKS
ncbi:MULTISPECIES: hypothetical protein [Paenibacillus]|uniref:hypothetical protein n=1 Tax=Paenibacillus TaxID=44249 RepID=UPI0022B89ABE|nr:hypothetical protein [Paenibacillus caseinilyticus]MCZ8517865.1 hypothetical protein [Paenibacillus caseinilyticus]